MVFDLCKCTLSKFYVTGLPSFCLNSDAVWLFIEITISRNNPNHGYERNTNNEKGNI